VPANSPGKGGGAGLVTLAQEVGLCFVDKGEDT